MRIWRAGHKKPVTSTETIEIFRVNNGFEAYMGTLDLGSLKVMVNGCYQTDGSAIEAIQEFFNPKNRY